jgi:putative colanic acid biosynthesis glycosyltransferase
MILDIVTVTRNNLVGLESTYASIQTINIEPCSMRWIIIDGNSSDGTKKWLKNLQAEFEIIKVSELDTGIYDAMNKGIDLTKSSWIWFLNAGDRVAEGFDFHFLHNVSSKYSLLVFNWALEVSNKLINRDARNLNYINHGMITSHQAILYSFESLRINKYDTSFKIAGDYNLTAMIMKENVYAVKYFPKVICIFSRGGISSQNKQLLRSEASRVQRETLGLSWHQISISRFRHIIAGVIPAIPSIYKLFAKGR